MQMPFGKYRGFEIEDIPIDYLEWVLDNVDLSSPRLRAEIESVVDPGLYAQEIVRPSDISRIYKELSKKWHPDKSGTKEAMQAINDFYSMAKENIVQIEVYHR